MYEREFTPERITELKPNEVFVFGSNLAGSHGGGAARFAYTHFGAVWGHGVGMQGQSYAIPTMQGGVETIKPYIDEFIGFAKSRPSLKFLVTKIGCGIAGFKAEDIALLFDDAFDIVNIILPEEFVYWINKFRRYRSETNGIAWEYHEIEFYPEDVEKMKSMTLEERNAYMIKLKTERRFTIKD